MVFIPTNKLVYLIKKGPSEGIIIGISRTGILNIGYLGQSHIQILFSYVI